MLRCFRGVQRVLGWPDLLLSNLDYTGRIGKEEQFHLVKIVMMR